MEILSVWMKELNINEVIPLKYLESNMKLLSLQ